jgi:hypothetical protein
MAVSRSGLGAMLATMLMAVMLLRRSATKKRGGVSVGSRRRYPLAPQTPGRVVRACLLWRRAAVSRSRGCRSGHRPARRAVARGVRCARGGGAARRGDRCASGRGRPRAPPSVTRPQRRAGPRLRYAHDRRIRHRIQRPCA